MAASSTAKLFSSPGFGHIDPSVERGQLRKEIDAETERMLGATDESGSLPMLPVCSK